MRIPVPPPEQNRARVNERIRVPQVLLIDETGEKVGVTPTEEARRRAEAVNLDLVEVAANARPPVCRIMDYGRYLFEQQKKERASSKRNKHQEPKEIRLRPGTDSGDMNIKSEKARGFLAEGYKVAIQLQFRGRERSHPEMGVKTIEAFARMLEDSGKVEQAPRLEGRRMNALIAPLQGVGKKSPELLAKDKAKAEARAAAEADDEEPLDDDDDERDHDDLDHDDRDRQHAT